MVSVRLDRVLIGMACLVAAWGALGVHGAWAAEDSEKSRWEIGIVGGSYRPSLDTLNEVLTAPNQVILQDPNQQLQPNVLFPPEVRNPYVPPFDQYSGTLGLEMKYRYLPRHAFVLTLNLWHSQTQVSDIVPFVAGANVNDPDFVPRETLYEVQISQVWMGWRYTLWEPSQRSNMFLDLGLLGIAFGDVTITTILKENNPAVVATPFAVASSLEATGYGVTARVGAGGEYFFTDWLSLSARTAYVVGEIPQLKVDRFFRAGFSVPPPPQAVNTLPPQPQPGEIVTHADVRRPGADPNTELATGTAALPLELNGLEFMFGVHFYF